MTCANCENEIKAGGVKAIDTDGEVVIVCDGSCRNELEG